MIEDTGPGVKSKVRTKFIEKIAKLPHGRASVKAKPRNG
jgi:hypothetical protein